MSQSLVLQPPHFEDRNKAIVLEELLGRFVKDMDLPLDNFRPPIPVSIGKIIAPYKLESDPVSFRQYCQMKAEAQMHGKMTNALQFAHKNTHGTYVDLELTQATTLNLHSVEDAFRALATYGKTWFEGVEQMWKDNNYKLYWIVGITIVHGGKIESNKDHGRETNVGTKGLGKAAANAALASQCLPTVVDSEAVDLRYRYAKKGEGSSRGQVEFKGRCLYSLRYYEIGTKGFLIWKPNPKHRVRFQPHTPVSYYMLSNPALHEEGDATPEMHFDEEGLKEDLKRVRGLVIQQPMAGQAKERAGEETNSEPMRIAMSEICVTEGRIQQQVTVIEAVIGVTLLMLAIWIIWKVREGRV
ncbi:uncharacterized protein Aud_010102 [Aspergillus udagawae]|uniref:Uncharacterized protein n=1 Tax=Aspergillus udagawae TaxID=91492 RepID=A0A8E0V5R2_9EURO|nr:uncharacterized protein Aud_010102 [Aspergillus udagawae]GIC93614.1 hypothetical protein Aud_010102 [Aspergillus udagawae]